MVKSPALEGDFKTGIDIPDGIDLLEFQLNTDLPEQGVEFPTRLTSSNNNPGCVEGKSLFSKGDYISPRLGALLQEQALRLLLRKSLKSRQILSRMLKSSSKMAIN